MAAEIENNSSGKKRRNRRIPRIDMTPLVDLGFLLLTFFVLTTTLNDPFTMPVVVPADKVDDPVDISQKKILNLLLTGDNRVFYYQGVNEIEMNLTSFSSSDGIRQLITKKKAEIQSYFPDDHDPMIVLIKMSNDATYKNWVDIIDEMNIGNQKKYMLLDITKDELNLVKEFENNEGMKSSIINSLPII